MSAALRLEDFAAAPGYPTPQWRVRGPLRGQDGSAVWQVVRDLIDVPGALRIDSECMSAGLADKRAAELRDAELGDPERLHRTQSQGGSA